MPPYLDVSYFLNIHVGWMSVYQVNTHVYHGRVMHRMRTTSYVCRMSVYQAEEGPEHAPSFFVADLPICQPVEKHIHKHNRWWFTTCGQMYTVVNVIANPGKPICIHTYQTYLYTDIANLSVHTTTSMNIIGDGLPRMDKCLPL